MSIFCWEKKIGYIDVDEEETKVIFCPKYSLPGHNTQEKNEHRKYLDTVRR